MSQEFRRFFSSLDEQQKIELLITPFMMAAEVAEADGESDINETQTRDMWFSDHASWVDDDFATALNEYGDLNEFRRDWLSRTMNEDELADKAKTDSAQAEVRQRVCKTLKKMPEAIKKNYKRFTIEGMFQVALASGVSGLHSWEKVDEQEMEKIHSLMKELEFDMMDLLWFVAGKDFS